MALEQNTLHVLSSWILSIDNQINDQPISNLYQLILKSGKLAFENERHVLSVEELVVSKTLGGLRGRSLHDEVGRVLNLRIACRDNKLCKVFNYCAYDPNSKSFQFDLYPTQFCHCRQENLTNKSLRLILID